MKHCVITGAATPFGRALARRFAQADYSITGIGDDATQGEHFRSHLVAKGYTASWITANLTLEADVQHILSQLSAKPTVNVCIHHATLNKPGLFAQSDLKQQKAVLTVNFLLPVLLTNGLLDQGSLADGSSVVFMASLAHFTGYPGAAIYAASKEGQASYARSLAVILARRNMHVLTVYAGLERASPTALPDTDDDAPQHKQLEQLSNAIYRAVQSRRRLLIPGFGNRMLATFGPRLPGLMRWMLRSHLVAHTRT
jgi:Short-chain dehydrogenases of various substrate specificities